MDRFRSSFKNKKEKKLNGDSGEDVVREEHVEVEKCQSDVTIDSKPTIVKSIEPIAHSSLSTEEKIPPVLVETEPIVIPDSVEDRPPTPVKEETPVESVTKVEQSEEPIPPPLPPKTTSLSEVEIDEAKLSPRTLSLSEAILEELDLTLDKEEKPKDAEGKDIL